MLNLKYVVAPRLAWGNLLSLRKLGLSLVGFAMAQFFGLATWASAYQPIIKCENGDGGSLTIDFTGGFARSGELAEGPAHGDQADRNYQAVIRGGAIKYAREELDVDAKRNEKDEWILSRLKVLQGQYRSQFGWSTTCAKSAGTDVCIQSVKIEARSSSRFVLSAENSGVNGYEFNNCRVSLPGKALE